ncbi:MAG: alpha-L-fucosidase [Planctomycetaceae bacterium]|nr:alpha-L-fucosidase [Planctomycetaceae bacterium]
MIKIAPADRTVLLAADAEKFGPMTEAAVGIAKRGWLGGWTGHNEIIGWHVNVPSAGEYELAVVAEGMKSRPLIEVAAGKCTLRAHVGPRWQRVALGKARLTGGKNVISLRSVEGHLQRLFSLEIVKPAVAKRIAQQARKSGGDCQWLAEAGYGLMFHWTSQTCPHHGGPLPYAQAVDALDVDRVADTVAAAGAGHVIWTTSHAGFFWPGPNAAIDKILPGRTCKRDLIGELADALAQRGARLMLYYHPGHDDGPWWSLTGFDKTDKSAFFKSWMKIIAEAGKRYGRRLAGWWFDDAMFCYYPYNPPWQKLAATARTGNPQRLICWNSWVMPKVTDWGDLASWEDMLSPELIRGHGHLPLSAGGRYPDGPQEGLQAHITTPATKGGWVHSTPNTPVGGQAYQTPQLIRMLTEARRRRCAVTLNLEIYQEGHISRAAAEQLAQVNAALSKRKRQ